MTASMCGMTMVCIGPEAKAPASTATWITTNSRPISDPAWQEDVTALAVDITPEGSVETK